MTSVLTYPAPSHPALSPAARDRLAVVGMDCLFPDAIGLDPMWQNVLGNRSSVSLIEDRYLPPALRPQVGTCLGAKIPELQIRSQKFRLPPSTTRNFDPRILPMLEVVDRVMKNHPDLNRESTRVIMCCQKMFPKEQASTSINRRLKLQSLLSEVESLNALPPEQADRIRAEVMAGHERYFPNPGFEGFLAESGSLMTSIISKTFNFGGGHIVMDATCASTIAATQIAWDALCSGHCDAAIIVALSVEVVPSRFVHYAQMGLLARDAVLPFDQNASGSAIGEGIGAVLVKRLEDAEAANDPIYGVIRGIGFSSDGSGSGFVSPQLDGQVRAMKAAYQMAGVDPTDVRLVEAHATSTQKGDLTELRSMNELFTKTTHPYTIGSIKGNIGHLLAASGMAGLFKACRSLNEAILPPTIFRTPRSELQDQFDQFELLKSPQPWPEEDPYRLAAVSSFGFGGVDAHLLIEGHPSTAKGMTRRFRNGTTAKSMAPNGSYSTPFTNGSVTAAPATVTPPAPAATATGGDDYVMVSEAGVEAGVLQIISECTGYEIEELQLDHDLDADLGVDSLKHVEILLKVGQQFRVQASEDDQITDYPTIVSLVTLAKERQNTATGEQPAGLMAGLMAGMEGTDLPPEAMQQLSSQMGVETPTPPSPAPAPVEAASGVTAPVVTAAVPMPEAASDYVMRSDSEVETGVLDIISECTGYEVEELQLDHDLDADLGVDSLKHVEILLKVGQEFRVQASEDDQITDYPTIVSLVTLAKDRQNTATGEQPAGLMAGLMAGMEGADLPEDAAQQLAQLNVASTQPMAPVMTPEFTTPPIAPQPDPVQPAAATDPTNNDYVMRSDTDVETGVLDIISECTGYEVEELQLDHDLDADLGVDSLKHVEILLKVGQEFRVQASEDDQITDYPTIVSLVTLAKERQNTATGEQPAGLMAGLMANLDGADLPSEAAQQLVQQMDPGQPATSSPAPTTATVPVEAPMATAPVPSAPAAVVTDPANDYVVVSNSEVESGVLSIISECTGYEIEELQLDHDLDADLGVDSLKHVEILLKVGQQFRVQASEDDQITDYPTIVSLVTLAQERQNTATGEQPADLMAGLMAGMDGDLPPEAAQQLSQMGLSTQAVPEPTIQPSATAPQATPSLSPATAPTAPDNDYVIVSNAEVEAGVLNIISDCTGYEIEELQVDHDLDADLGVDSLKHVEILLKVGQQFRVQASEDDQITDYPTIASLVRLAQERQNTSTGEPSGMMAELMAGLDGAELPPEAAQQLAQMGVSSDPAPTASAPAPVAPTPVTPMPPTPPTQTPDFIKQVAQAVASLRNYEADWLTPHLTLQADLGLTPAELAQLSHQLGVSLASHQDYALQDLAALLAPATVPVAPASVAPQPATPVTSSPSVDDWVLVVGQGSLTELPTLAARIYSLLTLHPDQPVIRTEGSGTHAFALVVNRAETSEAQLARTLQQSAGKTLPLQSIWWHPLPLPAPQPMAWLFPGSGSLYPGLVADLNTLSPVVAQVLNEASGAYQALVGRPLSFEASTDPLWQRPATVAVSAAVARLLKTFGVEPAFVGGHSVGELTACHIAGAFDLKELMRLTTAPFQGLATYPQGSMVALVGPEAVSLDLVQASAGRVVVSNRNSAHQLVVSGRQEDVQTLSEEAVKRGIQPHRLEVQTPYHSPFLAEAHQAYRDALRTAQFLVPSIPVISGLTGDLLPWSTLDSSQTRALLDCAFIAPVNYPAQLQRLQGLGARVFVDMGPTSRLARLAQDTLGTDGVTILAANRTKRNSRLVLLETLAQLYVIGHPIQSPVPPTGSSSSVTPTTPAAPPSAPVKTPVASTAPAAPIKQYTNGQAVMAQSMPPAAPSKPQAQPASTSTRFQSPLLEPIAVVGMGALMPDADSTEEFWNNILNGHDAIREIPQDSPYRWKIATYYDEDPKTIDKSYSKIGAFVPNFQFKPKDFRITPKTAIQMDRAQKMALLATREAFQDSGYHERPFDKKRVKVIIGTSVPEHHDLAAPRMVFDEVVEAFQSSEVFQSLPEAVRTQMVEQARKSIHDRIPSCTEDSMAGGLPNIVAGRVAFCFDLQGGNVILDAACAASMAALDHAVKSLRLGEADMVVMGGSDSTMSASAYVGFCKTYALSAKGSSPFDAKADGFVMGEGCGILLLKRLSDAEAAEDKIYAVIRGVGSSSDGRGSGITAPSIQGQTLAMMRTYDDTGIDPTTIGYVEAHGTSTSVGDVAEFSSLMQVFADIKPRHSTYLGSIKSMVGHLKTAAGVAGLIKAIQSVRHGVVPPTLNFETPSPRINLAESPFIINTETVQWNHAGATPRRACVNSFGFGGTNFHVVVEAYDPAFYRSETFHREILSSRIYKDLYGHVDLASVLETVETSSVEAPPIPAVRIPQSPTPSPTIMTSSSGSSDLITSEQGIIAAIEDLEQPLAVIETPARDRGLIKVQPEMVTSLSNLGSLQGWIPAMRPDDLGACSFRRAHGVRLNYIAGAMAGGIGSVDIVVSMAKAGMIGFFGSGGLGLDRLESVLNDVRTQLSDYPDAVYGFNLLHNPIEAGMEDRTIDLYLNTGCDAFLPLPICD